MLVTAVGEQSEWGRTMALVMGEAGDTPLQENLAVLATAIGKIGFVSGWHAKALSCASMAILQGERKQSTRYPEAMFR
jgi:hypothetical protein